MCVTVKQIISCGFGREHQHIQHKPCALMMSVRWTMLKNWPRTTLEQRDAPHWMKSINNFSWWIVVPNSWNTTGSVRTLLFFKKIAGSACTLLYFIWLWMTTLWNPQRRERKVSSNLGKIQLISNCRWFYTCRSRTKMYATCYIENIHTDAHIHANCYFGPVWMGWRVEC